MTTFQWNLVLVSFNTVALLFNWWLLIRVRRINTEAQKSLQTALQLLADVRQHNTRARLAYDRRSRSSSAQETGLSRQ